MELLNDNQLRNVNGGGFSFIASIFSGVIFIIGVLDGYMRPYKCR